AFFSTLPFPPVFYPLSLHDALPISRRPHRRIAQRIVALETLFDFVPRGLIAVETQRQLRPSGALDFGNQLRQARELAGAADNIRSEEHTSELQSLAYLVCRLLLEKK